MVSNYLFGLIGKGISHSFSADYFNSKFQNLPLDARYVPFDIQRIDNFIEIISDHPNLVGLNVTSPYKREIIPFLNELSAESKILNAVNTIEFRKDENGNLILRGHNTDSYGFQKTLKAIIPEGTKALIMGTGGASSAVALALEKEGIPYLTVSRKPQGNQIGYEEMNTLLKNFKLLINATPLGMHPNINDVPDIDFENIGANHICYDLIYNPSTTLFLHKAAAKGAKTYNGLQMLLNQAELAWGIWKNYL